MVHPELADPLFSNRHTIRLDIMLRRREQIADTIASYRPVFHEADRLKPIG